MKAVIIYYTRTGNTKILGEKIKKRLESLNIEVHIYQDKDFGEDFSLNDFEIICLGSPTHYFQIAKEFKEFLKKVAIYNLKGKKLIPFATGSSKTGPPKICNDIVKVMKPTGIQLIAKIACIKSPTDELDLEIKKVISKEIL